MPSPPWTTASLRALNVVSPDFEAAIAADPLPTPAAGSDLLALREHRARLLQDRRGLYPIPGPLPEVDERVVDVRMRDGVTIPVKVYTPASPSVSRGGGDDATDGAQKSGGGPLIVMYHEGGFCFGDLTDEDQNCRLFARDLGATCVNVAYRVAPEAPFPKCIEDSWDALRWAASASSSPAPDDADGVKSLLAGADPRNAGFIVGGASAGGNVAAAMALLARDERLNPPLTGQFLCVPAVCPRPAVVPPEYAQRFLGGPCISMEENLQDPVLHPAAFPLFEAAYKPDATSGLFAPMLWPSGHRGVAKTYIQIAGMDPLRDEGLVYDELLKEAGVQTRRDLYPGYGHMVS